MKIYENCDIINKELRKEKTMALDGLFLHHLINEIKDQVKNTKIYNIISTNDTDYAFCLSNKLTLLISVSPSSSNIRITKQGFLASSALLSTYFKKHLVGGIIKDINQYKNDRLVRIDIDAFDDLGYAVPYKLYIELMGKNSNLIITNSDDIILEAVKKSYLTDSHLIKTGLKYIPLEDGKVSPFEASVDTPIENIQGLSKQVIQEINTYGIKEVLAYPVKPTLIYSNKIVFYCYDLKEIYGNRVYFDSLSSLLEYYYTDIVKSSNETQDLINTRKYLNKELEKAKNKLEKQKIELEDASNNEKIEKYANLLKANYHLIKPYTKYITVFDYSTNENIDIPLNEKLKPNENIDYYFNKIKKNKRAVIALKEHIEDTNKEIRYLNENLAYLDFSKVGDLKEIMTELGLKKAPTKKVTPRIAKYVDEKGNIYYFGKNNVQNNYLTHTFASANDYWFHVKSIPGSHVILRGILDSDSITLASHIAAYYSKARQHSHVCIDYTLVKWIKKIKGELGSNVIYTHEKTSYCDPSLEYINSHAKLQ